LKVITLSNQDTFDDAGSMFAAADFNAKFVSKVVTLIAVLAGGTAKKKQSQC
jgi:hypothetical protein